MNDASRVNAWAAVSLLEAEELLRLLRSARFNFGSEKELQAGIAQLLDASGINYHREHRLSDLDIIDFMVGSVGIEVKVSGSRVAVMRQLARYLDFPEVSELVLVTSRAQLLPTKTFAGKRIHAVRIWGGL